MRGGKRSGVISGRRAVAVTAVALAAFTALSAPAEARRAKHHRPAGGGYNPPYADMVVDVKTGRVLHAVNEDALRHPASVTKVMTLYLLFEQLERGRMTLETPLSVSAYAAARAPSKLGLRPGQTIEVEDAIKAIVTKSANDVASVIAENIGGSEDAFADLMTRKARALGMSRTHFANASGLPDPEQLTTARDLTVLARAIQDRFPRYYRYFQTRSFAFRGRVIGNHNRLVGTVEGVDGIKTGYTRDSGFNLMTSARLNGHHLVGVVLGGKSGASRDRIMADLVRSNLPKTASGERTSPLVVEATERLRPAVVAEATPAPVVRSRVLVASADDEVDTTAAVPRGGEPLDINPVRTGTTTPGSGGLKWRTGSQALPGAAQAYAGTASQAPFPGSKAAVPGPKSEARVSPETVRDTKAITPSAWVIQLGAMDDEGKAKSMLAEARSRNAGVLSRAAPFTERVSRGGTMLYRARFSGFAESDDAQAACQALKRTGFTCFATRS